MPDLLSFNLVLPDQWSPDRWREVAALAPLAVAMVVAAVVDWRSRRIPNWLTFSLFGVGLLRGLLATTGLVEGVGIGGGLLGTLAGAALAIPLFVLGARGAGDAKLYMATGAWIGPVGILELFLVESSVGAAFVVGRAICRGQMLRLTSNTIVLATTLLNVRRLGVATAAATGQHLTVYNATPNDPETPKRFSSIDRPLPHAVPALAAFALCLLLGHI